MCCDTQVVHKHVEAVLHLQRIDRPHSKFRFHLFRKYGWCLITRYSKSKWRIFRNYFLLMNLCSKQREININGYLRFFISITVYLIFMHLNHQEMISSVGRYFRGDNIFLIYLFSLARIKKEKVTDFIYLL